MKKNTTNTTKNGRFSYWADAHKKALNNALQRLFVAPIATFLTVLVVGVSLSLPTTFQILVNNLENGQQSIDKQSRITLYLENAVSTHDIDTLISELKTEPSILSTAYISAEQGLEDFQKHNVRGNSLTLLGKNPLPAVIQVFPDTHKLSPTQIDALSKQLAKKSQVNTAKIDILWLKRLFAITHFVKQVALIISLFLIFTVLIVIGNTIKLLGRDFHDEITVSKLVGATDAYVRRPFLYSGVLYGALGSIFALCVVLLGLLWLNPHIKEIGELYQTQIILSGLSFGDVLSVLATGMILGLGGAWIAANHLIHDLSL